MKLDLHDSVAKFLATLDAKRYRQVCSTMIGLCRDPQPHDSEQLQGFAGIRRVDVGEYRIVYRIAGDTVDILVVGRRNDDAVYRERQRRMG